MVHVVLYAPEMPANTGNIGRTCVAAGAKLHLIRPLGFQINDKMLKRAGLDYWPDLDVTVYDDYGDFLNRNPGAHLYMATTKSRRLYTEMPYEDGCYLMFGPESSGIPEEILVEHPEDTMRIPMVGDTRSLNLANSAAIVVYEALRHQGFPGLNTAGNLHRLTWPEGGTYGNSADNRTETGAVTENDSFRRDPSDDDTGTGTVRQAAGTGEPAD